jgi:LPXTG-site transpeptidase (sortase) family protein
MTATMALRRSKAAPAEAPLTASAPAGRRSRTERVSRREAPPLSPRLQLVRASLVLVLVVAGTLLLQLVVVSSLQQSAAQGRMFDRFRADLAKGTAAIGPIGEDGKEIAAGTPIAYLEIPEIDVQQVIGEGTSASVLFDGPGHRRDTPLPGQIGTSVIFGRRASFGGPFERIASLDAGDTITVTTGQGTFEYTVIGVRLAGDPAPPAAAAGVGRLTLVTAGGREFLPEGVIRVDAELAEGAVVGAARLYSAAALPNEDRLMAADTRTLWVLAFWLQALIAVSLGAVWAWHRWGHAQAWVVFLPVLLLVGLSASGEVARLLPNLL